MVGKNDSHGKVLTTPDLNLITIEDGKRVERSPITGRVLDVRDVKVSWGSDMGVVE